jgi:hypothetical protein
MNARLYRQIERQARGYEWRVRARRWGIFPFGFCFVASLELAPLLRRQLGLTVGVVKGVVGDCRQHAWIELPDCTIIDPTYGQFDGGPAMRILHPHEVDRYGHCAEIPLQLAYEEYFLSNLDATGPIEHRGWRPGCGIDELFSEWPRLPVLPNVVGI